jgi:hypothetical protein
MNATLLKALVALAPVGMLLSGSVAAFLRAKKLSSFLQLLGSTRLIVVILTHVAEAPRLFLSMHWGLAHSLGHHLDFWSAALGVTFFPTGYLLQAVTKRDA